MMNTLSMVILLMQESADAGMSYAAEEVESSSMISWMFKSLGPFYGTLIPFTGIIIFIGACLIVLFSRQPKVIGAYLVFLPVPLLIGLLGFATGCINSFWVIAESTSTPKPSELVDGFAQSMFSLLIGLLAIFPSYFVLSIGLLLRTIFSSKTE